MQFGFNVSSHASFAIGLVANARNVGDFLISEITRRVFPR